MLLKDSLEQLQTYFNNNELAYFALTSKVEQPIRDKLAFVLHQKIGDLYTLREWNRVDIAILNETQEANTLIELTASHSFELAVKPDQAYEILEKVKKEEAKLQKYCSALTNCYTVLLMTHIENRVPEVKRGYVKYSKLIERAFSEIYYPEKIKALAKRAVQDSFKQREFICFGEIPAGIAFDTEVSVLYWIYKS